MATAQIRNLINTQIDKQIYKAKKDLRNQGTKQIQKVKERLPSKEELKEKLISNSCNPKSQDKMTKLYDKLIKLINNLLKIPEKGLKVVRNIDKKLKKIRDKIIPKIQKILDFLNSKVIPALLVVVIAAEIALAASSGPAANGRIIDKMGEKKRLILGKIKEYAKLAATMIAALNPIIFMIDKLFNIMEVVIATIQGIIALIKKLKTFIIFLFRNYIKKCNIADQSPISTDENGIGTGIGTVNPNLLDEQIQIAIDKAATGTLTATDSKDINDKMTILYNDLLEDLKEDGQTKIIERLTQTENDLRTSYEVKIVPIP